MKIQGLEWKKFNDEFPEDGKNIIISDGTDLSITTYTYTSNSIVPNEYKLWAYYKEDDSDGPMVTTSYDIKLGRFTKVNFTYPEQKNNDCSFYANWGLLIPQDKD